MILSNNTFRKYYDQTLASPKHLVRIKSLEASATNFVNQIKSEAHLAAFNEKAFLKNNSLAIFLSTFGLDFLLQGVGNKESNFGFFSTTQSFRNGQATFLVSNYIYYGIPITLGFIKPILWWTIIPFIIRKANKVCWRIKHEHYFGP